jgi:hypothetical protein
MLIKIAANDRGNPIGKLAEAELHFDDGPLAGLKLIGFSIWERRGQGNAGRNVTFPARAYSVNGERRSFALLRPIADTTAQVGIRDLILRAYADFEEAAAVDTTVEPSPPAAPDRDTRLVIEGPKPRGKRLVRRDAPNVIG